ncbi:hypothetical protein [Leisingera sp. S232]|uniref:hypothetical protein n=1 Tax=Leisingera sp. S232 TaxID=3415132 RepID=UPI00086E5B00|nr:hypothetical protein AB838_16220 [Rhodobacteraceae bacterium (ex Bugula neritina AB1)]
MRHLPVSAPSFAVASGVVLMLFGAPWWLAAAALLLGAPFFVAVCYVICTAVLPCDPALRKQRR